MLVGSSVAENADVNECNSLWNCNMIKVTYAGGSSYNHKSILDVCFSNNPGIRTVYWNLDEYALTADPDTPRSPLPEYLYNNTIADDASYLLNLDVFYYYIVNDILGTLKHKNKPAMFYGDMWSTDDSLFGRDKVLDSYDAGTAGEVRPEDYYADNVQANLDKNIIPFIESQPDTQFVFFMPPYSILSWHSTIVKGDMDATMNAVRMAVRQLIGYDNVKLYFFQDDWDVVTDLDMYKDTVHFRPEVNCRITKRIADNECLLTAENHERVIDEFEDYVRNFDYDSLLGK